MLNETQTLLTNQITKIFSIIEKNSDNPEICKIALETLSNKCNESPIFIFPILTNFLEYTSKGNLKLVEDSALVLESFFEDFSYKVLNKIMFHEVFKSQLSSLLSNNSLLTDPTSSYIINNKKYNLENVNDFKFISLDIFHNLDIEKFEYLYSKDKESNTVGFTQMEMNIMFPDDKDRKEMENDMRAVPIKFERKKKLSVVKFYSDKSTIFDLHSISCLTHEKGTKKRKAQNGNQNKIKIHLNPFWSFINELIQYNSLSYSQRLCSVTLLRIMEKYLNKIFYAFYVINITHTDKTIEEIKVEKDTLVIPKLREKMLIDLIAKLVLDSFLDKVVDYTNQDYICISKELNLQLASLVLKNIDNEKITNDFTKQMIVMLDIFYEIKKDWQPLFAVLTLFKYLFLSSTYISDKCQLFEMLSRLMTTRYEDILNLSIQILDKILESNLINNFIPNCQIKKMFLLFIKLISRYDDIESGVKYYFNCLYNFVIYFLNQTEQNDSAEIFEELKVLMNNDFIFHSMNKILGVRIKFFEVINNLLFGKFPFEYHFIEKSFLIAYQGLCIEEDKNLLKIQQSFLMNVIMSGQEYLRIFEDHKERIINLLLEIHISNLDNFFVPESNKVEISEIVDLYKSFFVNAMQVDLINKAYERKVFFVLPIIALVLKMKVDLVQVIYSMFNIDFVYTGKNSDIILRRKLFLLLKIYLYYLEFIESDKSKILIINDEVLKFLSDNATLNELQIRINKKNIENVIGVVLNYFYVFSKGLLGNGCGYVVKLELIIEKLKEEQNLSIRELNNCMKGIYDIVKRDKCDQLKKCCEHIKFINDSIAEIEKNQFISLNRIRVRGYASVCLFIHSLYTNIKSPKISSITNSFLNCLKINNKEAKIFVKYILKLIMTLDNTETKLKIIVTFIENSIKCFNEATDPNETKNTVFRFRPIKYFFGEFSKCKKFSDIQKIIGDYENHLIKNCDDKKEIKIITILYLLTSIKTELFCFDFEKLKSIIQDFQSYSETKNIVEQISTILIHGERIFLNYSTKKMMDYLFSSIDLKEKSYEFNVFILKIIESILHNNKMSTESIDFIFTVLHYINYKDNTIRQLAISIFSKQMKIISMLKFDTNYDQIAAQSSVKSLDFITKIFTQNIYDIKELKIPVKEQLRSYQLIGVNWLLFLGNYGLGLALCDDMGLGKTIQTLVTIAHASLEHFEKTKVMPVSLIVCPSTLILNWVIESKKFFSTKDLITLQVEEKADPNTKFVSPKPLKPKGNSVTIYVTSYEKVRENNHEIFTSTEFFYLVLDEAHIIKNPKTKMYQSIRKIISERRIILTGTPIQNNVMELWSLFDFLMPGFLGNENDFEIKYHKKIHSNIKKLNLEEKLQENIFQASLTEIRKRIKPFILRRLKSDVLQELPEKIVSDYSCEMTQIQREIYDKCEKLYQEPSKKNASALSRLDKLRKICNHPYLLQDDELKLPVPKEDPLVNSSGKLKSLEELLISLGFEPSGNSETNISYENKVLIFTQYKQMCNLLMQFFHQKFPSLSLLTLTSDTKVNDRAGIVMKFNSDPSVNIMLLTTSIGGHGINLTSANIVIMYDHNWNPSVDLQAIDRAHRLGQKKTVQVFRMITVNSIEEQLISLQTFKKYIANNVVDPNKIYETKINANSVMESFEEFSESKLNEKEKRKSNKKKVSKIEELTKENEEDTLREELEIEYLKKLIGK